MKSSFQAVLIQHLARNRKDYLHQVYSFPNSNLKWINMKDLRRYKETHEKIWEKFSDLTVKVAP